MIAYKLVTKRKEGVYSPLYVKSSDRWRDLETVIAVPGERTASGKVKSDLGELAYRPGLHMSQLPFCLHIGAKAKHKDAYPSFRRNNQVWIMVEIPELSYQAQADASGSCARLKQLDRVPVGGFYYYKTNSNASDLNKWIIAGEMRIIKELTDSEVESINALYGVHDLPRR